MMAAAVNVNQLATHRPNMKAGSVYSLTGFDVTRSSRPLSVSTESAIPISVESFLFRNHNEMLGLANTNTQLLDLIGEITALKRVLSLTLLMTRIILSQSLRWTRCEVIQGLWLQPASSPRWWELCRLVAQDTGLAQAAPLLRGFAKVESLRIAELNDFVITAPSQTCQPELKYFSTGCVSFCV
ncbi:Uncharacterized protein Rs2_40290 [Raphanus sativus]|nr:Uncharacterized protein Rs2_40290 [Raphanus sativus]